MSSPTIEAGFPVGVPFWWVSADGRDHVQIEVRTPPDADGLQAYRWRYDEGGWQPEESVPTSRLLMWRGDS